MPPDGSPTMIDSTGSSVPSVPLGQLFGFCAK